MFFFHLIVLVVEPSRATTTYIPRIYICRLFPKPYTSTYRKINTAEYQILSFTCGILVCLSAEFAPQGTIDFTANSMKIDKQWQQSKLNS